MKNKLGVLVLIFLVVASVVFAVPKIVSSIVSTSKYEAQISEANLAEHSSDAVREISTEIGVVFNRAMGIRGTIENQLINVADAVRDRYLLISDIRYLINNSNGQIEKAVIVMEDNSYGDNGKYKNKIFGNEGRFSLLVNGKYAEPYSTNERKVTESKLDVTPDKEFIVITTPLNHRERNVGYLSLYMKNVKLDETKVRVTDKDEVDIISGKHYTVDENTLIDGSNKYNMSKTELVLPGLNGALNVYAIEEYGKAKAGIYSQVIKTSIFEILPVVIMVVVIYILLSKVIVAPIKNISAILNNVVRRGKVSESEIEYIANAKEKKNEIGLLASSIFSMLNLVGNNIELTNNSIHELNSATTSLRDVITTVQDSTNNVQKAMSDIARQSMEQAEKTSDIVGLIHENDESIGVASELMSRLTDHISSVRDNKNTSVKELSQLSNAILNSKQLIVKSKRGS